MFIRNRSSVRVIDVKTGKEPKPIPTKEREISGADISPDGRYLATNGTSFIKFVRISFVDLIDNTNSRWFFYKWAELAFTPDGKYLAVAINSRLPLTSTNSPCQLWAIPSCEMVREFENG